MTDRQQVERLMAMVEQAREAQKAHYEIKKKGTGDQVKKALSELRMKWDAVDNLFKALWEHGYVPNKHSESEQNKMF
jgi:hypothetical protein